MSYDWTKILVSPSTDIQQTLKIIDSEGFGLALVVDNEYHLLGTVTDGDIRRALIKDQSLNTPISQIMFKSPITVDKHKSKKDILDLMHSKSISVIPCLENGEIVQVYTLHQLLEPEKRDNPVFIMAGGFGTRLRPLTDNCPKPMLQVGNKPMLEHLINQFRALGFHDFYISTHYMPDVIQEHFGDGRQWDISITYIHEDTPLGTGGALGLLPKNLPQLPLIMMNGDVLTKIDFTELLDHHESHNLDATMCVRELEYKISYGVVESEGGLISNMVEKPTYRYHINTGIYVLSPECVASVKENIQIDLPTLLKQRINEMKKVGIYISHEYWLDIGQMADYQKAQQDIQGFYQ